jgi:RimJ/RimL family protein N-acetyltransferase
MNPEPVLPYTFAAPIHTERLVLRLMTEGDVDDLLAYKSREDVCQYLLYEPQTREDVVKSTARNALATTLGVDHDYFQLAVELPASEDAPTRVIGDIYFSLESAENSKAEIGWTFHPDFHGKGYASEAARAVLRMAFDDIHLHRVQADLDPRNDASIALCKRLGLREEAHFVKDLWFKGDWADTGIYAILDTEWAHKTP